MSRRRAGSSGSNRSGSNRGGSKRSGSKRSRPGGNDQDQQAVIEAQQAVINAQRSEIEELQAVIRELTEISRMLLVSNADLIGRVNELKEKLERAKLARDALRRAQRDPLYAQCLVDIHVRHNEQYSNRDDSPRSPQKKTCSGVL